MKEHGTLFKAEMVRALLRPVHPKTQTRRLFTRHNSLVDGARASSALWADLAFNEAWVDKGPSPAGNAGPYLKVPRRSEESVHRVYATIAPGDHLWVRETHCDARNAQTAGVLFRADGDAACRWTPGIHMPRDACRIVLGVTALRIERLQQISEADAIAEGMERPEAMSDDSIRDFDVWPTGTERAAFNALNQPSAQYRRLWERINGAGSWIANPFVRVFEFTRITP